MNGLCGTIQVAMKYRIHFGDAEHGSPTKPSKHQNSSTAALNMNEYPSFSWGDDLRELGVTVGQVRDA